ncbi:dickkopf-related protein 3 [Mantella aurantiaca]
MLLPFLAVALGLAAASPALRPVTSDDVTPEPLEILAPLAGLPEEKDSLNDLFREVQDLLKDSNSKLEKAVREMEAEEISADRVALKDLPPNYHNKTVKETKIGNNTIITKEEINKETNNETGSTFVSKTIVSSLQNGNKREHVSLCLLYPVCTPLLVTGEECRDPDSLLDIFSWDMESDAPLNHCPCASGLLCRGQRDGPAFACEEVPAPGKREEPMERPLFTFVPEEEIAYEDGNASPTALATEYDIPGDEGDASLWRISKGLAH